MWGHATDQGIVITGCYQCEVMQPTRALFSMDATNVRSCNQPGHCYHIDAVNVRSCNQQWGIVITSMLPICGQATNQSSVITSVLPMWGHFSG